MASEYTPNRRYPLYTDNDKPNLRDQYNAAIREIDTDMAQALQDSSVVSSALGTGFDAQHTVRMAIDSANASVSNEVTARESADMALGNRITQETSARESADTALGNRITQETSARESADTALGNRIDTLTETKYMVVIGDSFSSDAQCGTPLWYTYVAHHYGLQVHTTASDGVGFTVGTNNFATQLQNAITAMQGKTVERVYVLGGLNDTRSGDFNIDTTQQAVATLLNNIKNAWPNAKVAVYGPQSFPVINSNNVKLSAWMAYHCLIRRIEYHDLTMAFQLYNGFFGGKNGDNPHPSTSGQSIIATYIINHGNISDAAWVPSGIPTDLSSYPAPIFRAVVNSGTGTIEQNGLVIEQQFRKISIFDYLYEAYLDATKIPNTVTTVGFRLPYDAQKAIFTTGITWGNCFISQLAQNNICNGWYANNNDILFNINNANTRPHVPQTGNDASNIRLQVHVTTR